MASIFFGGLIHDGARVVLRFKDNQTCFPFWRFLKLRNSALNFWGLIFIPGIFLGFVASHMGLFLVSIFGPIQSSLSLKIGRFALLSSPPPLETLVRSSISTN